MSKIKKTYQFKLKPSRLQVERLDNALNLCRRLYNACLFQRRISYRDWGISLTCYDQIKQIPEIKLNLEEYKNVHSQVLQDVVRRVDNSYKNFFRRVKSGKERPGFPRYKPRQRYDSIVYPQSGWKLEGTHLVLSKIGTVKVILSRRIPKNSKVKTVSIVRDRCGDWFVSFSLEIETNVKPVVGPVPVERAVGIDVGINKLAVLSNGTYFENPKFLKGMETRLKRLHRNVSRKVKGSNNRRKANVRLAKAYRKLARQRNDYLHKISRYLVDNFDLISFEDLKIKNVVRNGHLAKHILDGCWDMLCRFTSYKAEEAGKIAIKVESKNSTQECSVCGARHKLSLSERFLNCRHNNLDFLIDRDLNSGLNVRQRAFVKLGWEPPEVKLAESMPLCPIKLDISMGYDARIPRALAVGV